MTVARKLHDHIDVSGRRPVVAGTDIKISQVASEHEHLGMSADEIVEAHPHLTLADVHAALAYYYDHPGDIRDEWREADSFIAALRERYARRDVEPDAAD